MWRDNPIFRQVLGICSTLAVTNLVLNTIVMCVGLVFTLALSSATVSMLRTVTPRNVRMMVETLIIGFYVIIVDVLLGAYWPSMRANLGPYVGLILTNCIVMGRCEAYGISQPPGKAFLDGFFNCAGLYVHPADHRHAPRDPWPRAHSSECRCRSFPEPGWDKWIIMVTPPGAFFMLAIVVWFFRWFQQEREEKAK